jgi:chromatin segregation and condensation protein Rec8/ScpA/Scc1 (kleisin family)
MPGEEDMQQSEMMSGVEKEALAGAVMDSLGEPESAAEQINETPAKKDMDDLPLAAKERLGRQEKRHQKELRALQSQIQEMNARMGSHMQPQTQQPMNGYTPQPVAGQSVDEQLIHKVVNDALSKHEAKKSEAHVQKSYQGLQDTLDAASNKYDDFDDVVRSPDVPFTSSMRDTALLLPNPGEVLYKLGKNRPELDRISQLHPLEQAKEMVKLSVALQGGNDAKESTASRPLSNIKSNPVVAPGAVSDSTPIGELRRKLKAGWK